MVKRIVMIVLFSLVIIAVYGNFSPQGNMETTFSNLQTSMTTIAYAGELNEIRSVVDEFIVLMKIRGTDEGKLLALELDEKINNLELVKMSCNQKISTLELAFEINPYEKIQQICPALKKISLSKAVELFRLI